MKSKEVVLAAILVAGIALVPAVAEQVVLDVDSAVRMARQNNLSLQQARIDLGIKQRARDTAWNQFLPSLDGSIQWQPLASDFPPAQLSASLSSRLALSAANAYDVRARGLEYQVGVVAFEQQDKKLERDIRKSFYDLLLKQESIRLLEQSQETARKRYEQVSTNYEHGLASELDMLNAQVNLENLSPDLEKARTDYRTALEQFKQALGVPHDVELVLEGAIEAEVLSLDAEELIRSYGSLRLDYQTVRRELAVLENDRKLTGANEFSPVLDLRYSFGLLEYHPELAVWWSGASSLAISLSVPIDGALPSSASRVQMADADDTIRKKNLELTEVRLEGEIAIRTLVSSLKRSGLSIDVLKKNAELARRVYELTTQEYEAGLTDLLTLEESYDDLQQARLKVLTEQHDYQSLLLDLEYELNSRLES